MLPFDLLADADIHMTAGAAERQARDAVLVARLRQGDARALETLMRLYAPRLSTVAFTLLGNRDLVEDVLQDVFVSLWERREALDIHENMSGYLYRAVRNRALNAIRHQRIQSRTDDATFWNTDLSVSVVNDAERALEEADLKARVYAALRHVPPSPREVFLLRWEHDLSYDEIALTLGKTVPTVRELMYRATKRLVRYFRNSKN